MFPSMLNRYLLVIAVALSVAGVVDSALGKQWDFLTLFLMVLLVLAALLLRLHWRRPSVPVRADLVRWLERRAALTAEPGERIADRAIADYRDRMSPEDG